MTFDLEFEFFFFIAQKSFDIYFEDKKKLK